MTHNTPNPNSTVQDTHDPRTVSKVQEPERNYHGKYNMSCKNIRKAQYFEGMMCLATTYGTCMCEQCSRYNKSD